MPAFRQGFNDLRQALDAENLTQSGRARYNIELVFEEIIGNLLRHGAAHGRELHVTTQVQREGDRIVMIIEDDGVAFDPCGGSDSALARTLQDDRDGGFGLVIVRRASSAMHYERTGEDRNRLTVTLSALD